MSSQRTARRGFSESVRAWPSSLSFQVVVVPSLLTLIGLVAVDLWDRTTVAIILTLAVVAGGFLVYFFRPIGQVLRPTLAEGPRPDAHSYDSLVFALSEYREVNDAKFCDGLVRLLDAWQPRRITCLVSTAARKAGADPPTDGTRSAEGYGLHLARTMLADRGATVEFRFLADGEDLDPAALMEESLIAVRGLRRRGSVLVDITFGNKPMSVGLYEAAVEQGVNVGYQHEFGGDVTPQLILEERR